MTVPPFKPLTKTDVADILGVSIRTIENFVKSGRMPAPACIGARVFWHPELFFGWLDQTLRSGGWHEAGESDAAGERAPIPTGSPRPKAGGQIVKRKPSAIARAKARQARKLQPFSPASPD